MREGAKRDRINQRLNDVVAPTLPGTAGVPPAATPPLRVTEERIQEAGGTPAVPGGWGLIDMAVLHRQGRRHTPPPGRGAPVWEYAMNLGIAGRKAIVCASSKGLGRACAKSLAEAGCELVVNGRDRDAVEAAAADIRQATGAKVIAVAADVATAEGQKALFAACPEPDIVVNNNAGPPFRDFRDLTRQQIIDGVIANMVVAIEITQKAIDPMVRRNFGRIVNITSGTVKAPLFGLDLSSGARAGLTAFMAGVARSVASANVTINFMQPGPFATDRLQSNMEMTFRQSGWARQTSSAPPVHSCAPPMRATSLDRICCSTAARSRARSRARLEVGTVWEA